MRTATIRQRRKRQTSTTSNLAKTSDQSRVKSNRVKICVRTNAERVAKTSLAVIVTVTLAATATANRASRANASNRATVLKAIDLRGNALKGTVRTAQSVRTGLSGKIVRRANGSKANASKAIVQSVPIVMIAVSAMKTANAIASGLPILWRSLSQRRPL